MTVSFGPGMFWAPLLIERFDSNEDDCLARSELVAGFQTWFREWDREKSDSLSEDEVRAGLNKTLAPPTGFGPPGPGFGVPGRGFGPPGPGFGSGLGPPGPGPRSGPLGDPAVESQEGNAMDGSLDPPELNGTETSEESASVKKPVNDRKEP